MSEESKPIYRCLCTGASGHIGKHLVSALRNEGHDVYTLERYSSSRYGVESSEKTLYAEISDYYAVSNAIRQCLPQVVFHLAAIGTQDDYVYSHPHENVNTHLMGTINVAEACRHFAKDCLFLHASTAEVYGNHVYPDEYPLTEVSSLNPNSPYTVTKIAAEQYIQYLMRVYNFPAVILRPFNTYGFGVPARTLIDRVLHEMMSKKSPIALGPKTPIRDFLYIDDHVNAYLTCMAQMDKAKGNVFNFCSSMPISIEEVVDQMRALSRFTGVYVWDKLPPRQNEIHAILGSYKKALDLLGWEPRTTLVQGIRKIVAKGL